MNFWIAFGSGFVIGITIASVIMGILSCSTREDLESEIALYKGLADAQAKRMDRAREILKEKRL